MSISNPVSAINVLGRPLRLGVIGGGPGSFIGPIHMSAAVLDRRFVIVAGVLSSDAERAQAYGVAIGLPASRAYASVELMLAGEAARAPDERIEAVAVMTPNDRHYQDCLSALEYGLHVICDKPMVNSTSQARHLVEMVEDDGAVDQHLAIGKLQRRHSRDGIEFCQFRLVGAERHQAHVAVADAIEPHGYRDAPHKWRSVTAIKGHRRRGGWRHGLIFGHDAANFLR